MDALTLIINAYKQLSIFNEGDKIIVPANTYIANILAISKNNYLRDYDEFLKLTNHA